MKNSYFCPENPNFNNFFTPFHFPELLQSLTADVSCLMVLESAEGTDLAAKVCEIFGPENTELNTKIHTSKSTNAASRELALFFPEDTETEKTIALIRPGVLAEFGEEIETAIKLAGFVVAGKKAVQLNKEQVEEYYSDHAGKPFFEPLVSIMSGGECCAFLLVSENAISKWRGQLGPVIVDDETRDEHPNSLRVKFQTSSSVNSLHGSSTVAEFEQDLGMFFPELVEVAEAVVEENEVVENEEGVTEA